MSEEPITQEAPEDQPAEQATEADRKKSTKLDLVWIRNNIDSVIWILEQIREHMDENVEEVLKDQAPDPGPQTICPFCASSYIDDDIQIACRKGMPTGKMECACFRDKEEKT